ncbi:MAG: dockerin type I domain-containing protein [Planctomycetaceae bacterium]
MPGFLSEWLRNERQTIASNRTGSCRTRGRRCRRSVAAECLEERLLLAAVRLDDPQIPVGDVYQDTSFNASPSHQVSSDGQYAVYLADATTDHLLELFSVHLGTGTVTQLNSSLVIGGDIQSFQISPDSSRVVYLADQTTDNVTELFSVPIGGGPVTRLNGPLVSGGGVIGDVSIAADSSRVVYRAEQATANVIDLHSVPLTGGPSVRLNGPLGTDGDVYGFQVSPDSSRVVYLADETTDNVVELFSAPIASGGGSITVSDPLGATAGIFGDFQISPDSSRVVYRADLNVDNQIELFSASITATGTETQLSGSLVDPNSDVDSFQISPDSSRVIYFADQDTVFQNEVYSVPLSGGALVKLNAVLPTGGFISEAQISPDSTRVVYRGDATTDNVIELYSVPLAGGLSPVTLNGPLVAGGDVTSFRFSPDSSRVVYNADEVLDNQIELFSVPLSGGASTKLNGPLASTFSDINSYDVSADSSSVVYLAEQDVSFQLEVYVVPLIGGSTVKLNGLLSSSGDVNSFVISPDNSRVVYNADELTASTDELFSVPLTGGTSTRISGPLMAFGNDVTSFQLMPDGLSAVYLADQSTSGADELYIVTLANGAVTKLNAPLVNFGDVISYQVSPNGNHVVYAADQDTDNVFELYSASISDGTVTKLSGPMTTSGDIIDFRISPTGTSVVYRADQDTDNVIELYGVAVFGGAVSKLNGPLVSNGNVSAYELGSSRVVYRADQDIDGAEELFSVQYSGASLIKLNPALPAGRTVTDFALSNSQNRVVYMSDEHVDEEYELRSVSIFSGGFSTQLSGAMVTDGDVLSFQISPDGSRAVYRADEATNGLIEIFSVPVTTPNGRVTLNGTLASGADVDGFQISPNSTRVVYRADETIFNQLELYSVPIEGGTSVRLTPLPSFGDIFSEDAYAFTPDSAQVVYLAAQDAQSVTELYAVPVDGGPTHKLNAALPISGDVAEFVVSPDSQSVTYRAGGDTAFVLELYQVPLSGGPVRKLNNPLHSNADVSASFAVTSDSARVVFLAPDDVLFQNALFTTAQADFSLDLPNGNGDDSILIRANGFLLEVVDANAGYELLLKQPFDGSETLTINGTNDENDYLTIDYMSGGFFSLPGGITFNGGTGTGSDQFVLNGDGLTQAQFVSSGPTIADATVVATNGGPTNSSSFTGVERLYVFGVTNMSASGPMNVGTRELWIDALTFTDLGPITTVAGGYIIADAGLHLQSSELLSGSGTVAAAISSDQGSTINVTGNLTLGDAGDFDGVNLSGRLNIGPNTITLHDAHKAVLGSQTTLGSPLGLGTLNSANGIELPDTRTFSGRGTINTVSGEFENQGFVQGSGPGLTFNHLVAGAGDFGGTITFNGGTDFGNSPAKIDAGNITFGPSNANIVELGGLVAGSEFDQVNASGTVNLNGVLDVVFLDLGNGYVPAAGQSFDIINAASVTGTFTTENLPSLPVGLEWNVLYEADGVTLEINATAAPFQVSEIQVGSSRWSQSFRDFADLAAAGTGLGWSVPTGSVAQTTPLPWANINRLIVSFTDDIDQSTVVAGSNVILHGVNSSPVISNISYIGTSQMVIELLNPLPVDALRLEIQDTVLSTSGEPLDGDFVNNVDILNSGGPAPVGDPLNDFNFHLVTNPGDANRSGLVNISDAVIVFQNFLAQPGQAGYSIFADMNGDAILNISDAVIVFQRFLAMPPTSFPGLFGPGSGSGSGSSGAYPPSPITPAAPVVQSSMSSGTGSGYASSSTTTQPSASNPQQPPTTPPTHDLDALDEVLSDPVGDLLRL